MTNRIIWWHEIPRVEDFAEGFEAHETGWSRMGSSTVELPYDSNVDIIAKGEHTVTVSCNDRLHVLHTMLVDSIPTAGPGDIIYFRSPVIILDTPIINPKDYGFEWLYTNRLYNCSTDEVFLVVKEYAGWLLLNSGGWITKSAGWLVENRK